MAEATGLNESTLRNWREGFAIASRAEVAFSTFLRECKKNARGTDVSTESGSDADLDQDIESDSVSEKDKGYIYIMQDKPDRFKVGYSINPKRRLEFLQTGNVDLALSFTERVNNRMRLRERQVHADIDNKYNIRRPGVSSTEWYTGEGCTLEYLIGIIKKHA